MSKITPDELALMVQRGFEGINERLEETATRSDITTLKGDLGLLRTDVEGLKGDVRRMSYGLDSVREDLGDRLTTIADTLSGIVVRVNRRVDDLQDEVSTLKEHPNLR